MGRKQIIGFVVTAAVLTAAVAAAWGLEALGRRSTGEYAVTIVRGDETLASFDTEALRDLPTLTIESEGKTETGPAVIAVLRAAGVDAFESITVRGMGLRDEGVLRLTRQQVREDLVLDFADRGTVKLVSPELKWEDRVRDVTTIEVQ